MISVIFWKLIWVKELYANVKIVVLNLKMVKDLGFFIKPDNFGIN